MEDKKMTLFYSKRSEEIKSYTSGITDMGYFGDDKVDMEVIYDYIVVDLDNYVLDNIGQFKIVENKVKLRDDVNLGKYR